VLDTLYNVFPEGIGYIKEEGRGLFGTVSKNILAKSDQNLKL
jgi:hypothetical protein